jgi:hypothetical protein
MLCAKVLLVRNFGKCTSGFKALERWAALNESLKGAGKSSGEHVYALIFSTFLIRMSFSSDFRCAAKSSIRNGTQDKGLTSELSVKERLFGVFESEDVRMTHCPDD